MIQYTIYKPHEPIPLSLLRGIAQGLDELDVDTAKIVNTSFPGYMTQDNYSIKSIQEINDGRTKYNQYVIIAHDNTNYIGCCFYTLNNISTGASFFNLKGSDDIGFLNTTYVDKMYRGKGIATQMISMFQDECRRNRIKNMMLSVIYGNLNAYRLYTKLGYNPILRYLTMVNQGKNNEDTFEIVKFWEPEYKKELIKRIEERMMRLSDECYPFRSIVSDCTNRANEILVKGGSVHDDPEMKCIKHKKTGTYVLFSCKQEWVYIYEILYNKREVFNISINKSFLIDFYNYFNRKYKWIEYYLTDLKLQQIYGTYGWKYYADTLRKFRT